MIPKLAFGKTGHKSTRIIFGGYALSNATQQEADIILELLLKYGINHIDVAPIYGKAEERIGSWMENHRENFFLATKVRNRSFEAAWKTIQHSLELLRVDQIDLLQLHGLTNPVGWEKVMGTNGALKALIKARDEGLVRFLGVTGHTTKTPIMHMQSLERFNFDSVLLTYNYIQMQDIKYARDFKELLKYCQKQNIAVQTIKAIAKKPWENNNERTYNTYFYEPLVDQKAIDKSVHWVLGLKNSFMITAGDMQLLPKILDAADRFNTIPTVDEMNTLVKEHDIRKIF
ncbi:MAG: aldo/keto reductase [Asgard group archaeon]|nr:aldo/keto reductase [Asgard group archaeon]